MKRNPRAADKTKPIPAPLHWHTADLTRLREIVESHPDWVEQTARSFGRLPIDDLRKAGLTRLGNIIALLNAQAHFWREEAERLNTPENRVAARKDLARSIARKLKANGESPNPERLSVELRSLNIRGADASLWGLVFYDWSVPIHESSKLRSALAYSESHFRVLANKQIKELNRKFSSEILPMSIERRGKMTLYSPMVACGLLLRKLANMSHSRRAHLIELLLKVGALPPALRKFLSPR